MIEISLISFRRSPSSKIRSNFLSRILPALSFSRDSPRGANQDTERGIKDGILGCNSVSRASPTEKFIGSRYEKLVWVHSSRFRVAVFVTIVKRSDGFHDRFWENSQRVALFEVGSADFYRLIRCVQRVYK